MCLTHWEASTWFPPGSHATRIMEALSVQARACRLRR